ncbi:MAG: phosphotransferase [Oligoflexia bacterium]|nr:phosphotransferase [Oligoflexia bacterium]
MAKILESDSYYRFLSTSLKSKDVVVQSLAGDASARRYYRAMLNEDSYVLMSWEPFTDVKNYPFLNVLEHFAKHDVHVPKVINVSKEEGFVLLEDLGDLTLERKFWESQNPIHALEFYQRSIDEIIKIHYPCTADRKPEYSAFKIEFNTERLLWEINYAREHLLEKFLHLKFDDKQNAVLDKHFHAICEKIHQEPKFIAHRDYHSRNLMIKTGKMRVIDFQDARLGAVQYDLVSLLRDSYVDLNEEVAEGLLNYYLEKRREFIPKPVDREHFDKIYDLQSIQRCLKACGSFASFFNTRNDTRYLKYIRSTLQRVRRALLKFPEHRELLDLLTDQGLFEKDITPS